MSSPFYSVLIPSYNRPELIGAAVASVLANDWADLEVIISDNQSPRRPEIIAVLQPFLSDPRVQLHLQPINLYEAGNRDFLSQAARGEWQIILCDDDKLYPHALRSLDAAISQQPAADLFVFGYTVIDEHDRIAYSRQAPKPLLISARDPRLARELFVGDALPYWCYQPATFCSRRSVRDRIKPNRDIGIGDDLMFLIDYVNAGGAVQVVPEVLMYYRRMSAGQTQLQTNQSADDLPNLVTRAKILLHLSGRTDLQPDLAAFVASREFRQRLLYDPMIWTGLRPPDLFAQVKLPAAWSRELLDFCDRQWRTTYRYQLALRRMGFFVSLFGLSGLIEMGSVLLQRLRPRAD
jgi:glycosyltransferase involved in cell wall biosynthesis